MFESVQNVVLSRKWLLYPMTVLEEDKFKFLADSETPTIGQSVLEQNIPSSQPNDLLSQTEGNIHTDFR